MSPLVDTNWIDFGQGISVATGNALDLSLTGGGFFVLQGPLGKLGHLLNRWYTWPMLRKQIEYNASLARTLREVSRQMADVQARVALESILTSGLVSEQRITLAGIVAELEALRGRVMQLESELEGNRGGYGRARHN